MQLYPGCQGPLIELKKGKKYCTMNGCEIVELTIMKSRETGKINTEGNVRIVSTFIDFQTLNRIPSIILIRISKGRHSFE